MQSYKIAEHVSKYVTFLIQRIGQESKRGRNLREQTKDPFRIKDTLDSTKCIETQHAYPCYFFNSCPRNVNGTGFNNICMHVHAYIHT